MSLAPITSNLGVSRAKHLLRRACFHYNKNLLYTISNLNVDEAFEVLTQDNSIAYSEPYDPKPNDNPHGYWYHLILILQMFPIRVEKGD